MVIINFPWFVADQISVLQLAKEITRDLQGSIWECKKRCILCFQGNITSLRDHNIRHYALTHPLYIMYSIKKNNTFMRVVGVLPHLVLEGNKHIDVEHNVVTQNLFMIWYGWYNKTHFVMKLLFYLIQKYINWFKSIKICRFLAPCVAKTVLPMIDSYPTPVI